MKIHRHPLLLFVTASVVLAPLVYLTYLAIISWPDSTDYFLQRIDSAMPGPDGKSYIYVGDTLHASAYNFRHRINGTCLIHVDRIRENVGGTHDGETTIFQHVEQFFVGDGIIRQTSWPIAPVTIPITKDWFDDESSDEQDMDIYTAGTYECNQLDLIRIKLGIPRLLHDGEGHPYREKTRVTLKRRRP